MRQRSVSHSLQHMPAFYYEADSVDASPFLSSKRTCWQAVDDLVAPAAAPHPRTARVNTLKMTVAEALAWLREPPAEHSALGKLV